MKHIIKVENFDNLSIVRPLIAMRGWASGEPEFSIKEPRTVITGTWDPNLTDNTKEVLIRGDVLLYGKTDCYSLMFEDENSHLTINAGARLRVWQGGIVNNDCATVNYLTIWEDAVNAEAGELLLHPGVTVNNHPLGTVKILSNTYSASAQDYLLQRYSYPSYTIPTENTVVYQDNIPCGFSYFDYSSNSWKIAGYINVQGRTLDGTKIANPFVFYQFEQNNPTSGKWLSFTCNFILNDNYNLSLRGNYHNSFGISWFAKTKTSEIISITSFSNIYYYTKGINGTDVNLITPEVAAQYPYINPIFTALDLVVPSSAVTTTLLYKTLCWDFSFELDEMEANQTRGTSSLSKGSLMSSKPLEIDTTLEGSAIFNNPESPFSSEQDER